MHDLHNLQKSLLWLFLGAILATALFNTMRLSTVLWQTWQLDSVERNDRGPDQIRAIAFNTAAR